MKEKSSSLKSGTVHQQHHGDAAPFSFSKLLDPQASWDKDQLGDVLHWIRQAIGLICGLLWGAIPLVGAIWIVVFLLLSSGIVYTYYHIVLKVDEEEFGGHGTLLQEGMFASITLFLLSWIMVYSLLHF
uniref:TSA: Wollemia nobilis Ref_Wollemi_Transcript_15930_1025 transcribed RNA sequence n=1 Tax=Wollemia nobilis TaxID=56998 RepID=A0A0C9S315_9CONI